MREIPSAVLVTFYEIPEKEINRFLEKLSVTGCLVSTFLKRYTIDVPVGQEAKLIQQLKNSELVKCVNDLVIKGYFPIRKPSFKKPIKNRK